MDFNTALGIIRRDLEEARALLDQLSVVPGNHIAEMELARSRIRSSIELISILPKLKELTVPEDKVKTEAREEVRVDNSPPVELLKKQEVDEPPSPESVKVQEVKAERPAPPPPAKAREAANAILADKFSSTDRIGGMATSVKQDELITSVMHNKPISDIGAAIGINDKFYYIRELFSGDGKAYQDTIRRLNSAVSLGEAMKILDDSTVMGSDPAAQSAFVDVVRRKFNLNV